MTAGVFSEWGTLKPVVVGNPNVFVIPKVVPWVAGEYVPATAQFFEENLGVRIEKSEDHKERFGKSVEQENALVS